MTATLLETKAPERQCKPRTVHRRASAPVKPVAMPEPNEPNVLAIFLTLIVSLLSLGFGMHLQVDPELRLFGMAAPMIGYGLIVLGSLGVFLNRAFFVGDPMDKTKAL